MQKTPKTILHISYKSATLFSCNNSCIGIIYFVAQWIGADIGLETIIPVSGIIVFVWGTIVFKCVNSIREKANELEIEIKALK